MRRIHLVGRQNMGKTTLVEELLRQFCARGLAVGSIKHSGHDHELDQPGKDSHRHRQAGARPVTVLTPSWAAVHLPRTPDHDTYRTLEPLYAGCALVLVEGHQDAVGVPKVEVWRAAVGPAPLALSHADILAVVSDDPLPAGVSAPRWPRRPVAALAPRLERLVLTGDALPSPPLDGGEADGR